MTVRADTTRGATRRERKTAPEEGSAIADQALDKQVDSLLSAASDRSETTAEAIARMAPHHPGFMPYPAHEPKALVAIDIGLRLEAERLLSIALDEFARLYPEQSQGLDEPGQEMAAARLRRSLRIDPLTVAADPDSGSHASGAHAELTMMTGGMVDDDGRVTFCDAVGRVLRKPVADWIGFTASRLYHQAQWEYGRQINGSGLDGDEMKTLARELRRTLRMDALGILAFRSATACKVAEDAEADAFSGPIPAPSIPGAGTVSPDLLRATEAHRDARQLMLNDPAEDDGRTDWHVERIGRLAQVLRDIPARSLADLRHKVLYLWPGSLEGAKLNDSLAATFDSFRDDLDRLAAEPPPSAAEEPAADFEPWDRNGKCPVPTKAEWVKSADTSLVWLRVAFSLMCLDRKSLGESMFGLDDEAFNETLEGIRTQRDRFRALADMADTVLSRIVVALEAHAASAVASVEA